MAGALAKDIVVINVVNSIDENKNFRVDTISYAIEAIALKVFETSKLAL